MFSNYRRFPYLLIISWVTVCSCKTCVHVLLGSSSLAKCGSRCSRSHPWNAAGYQGILRPGRRSPGKYDVFFDKVWVQMFENQLKSLTQRLTDSRKSEPALCRRKHCIYKEFGTQALGYPDICVGISRNLNRIQHAIHRIPWHLFRYLKECAMTDCRMQPLDTRSWKQKAARTRKDQEERADRSAHGRRFVQNLVKDGVAWTPKL